MKKFLTLALALVMALALAVPAMAFKTAADEKVLEDYSFDFYFVNATQDDFFGGNDVYITDLPAADKGFVTNEVAAAVIEAVVEEDALPADDIQLIVTGDGIKWLDTDEPALSSASVEAKWEDDLAPAGVDADEYRDPSHPAFGLTGYIEYDLEFFDGDDEWRLNGDADEREELFTGYGNRDVTLRWLIFAKVVEEEASLTLTVQLDGAAGETLSIDGRRLADYVGWIEFDAGDSTYTVQAYEYMGSPTDLTLYDQGLNVDDAILDATEEGAANAGIYVITADYSGEQMVIVHDAAYRARVMLVNNGGTAWYLITNEGDAVPEYETGVTFGFDASGLYDGTGFFDAAATAANAARGLAGGAGAAFTEANMFGSSAFNNWGWMFNYRLGATAGSRAAERFAEDVCADLGLDPANRNGRLRPGDIGSSASADAELEFVLDIEPWQAYVTIPDIEVQDPPKTGDAATLAGFVMIVLAAAGVVVFRKVRA